MSQRPGTPLAAMRRPPRPARCTAGDASGATRCSRMHPDASRGNDDALHATGSAASSLHPMRPAHEIPGHRRCAAAPQASGAAGPHAAPQAARVHAIGRMMHQMQFCPFSGLSHMCAFCPHSPCAEDFCCSGTALSEANPSHGVPRKAAAKKRWSIPQAAGPLARR